MSILATYPRTVKSFSTVDNTVTAEWNKHANDVSFAKVTPKGHLIYRYFFYSLIHFFRRFLKLFLGHFLRQIFQRRRFSFCREREICSKKNFDFGFEFRHLRQIRFRFETDNSRRFFDFAEKRKFGKNSVESQLFDAESGRQIGFARLQKFGRDSPRFIGQLFRQRIDDLETAGRADKIRFAASRAASRVEKQSRDFARRSVRSERSRNS